MKFELFPLEVADAHKVQGPVSGEQPVQDLDLLSSDGSSKDGMMPISKLKVHGNQLTHQRSSPPSSPHPPPTATTVQNQLSEPLSQTLSTKQPYVLRRYEFIRRSLTRSGEKTCSPTFVIQGKKVTHKKQPHQNGDIEANLHPPTEQPEEFKLDFDPIAFLESKMYPVKGSKSLLPLKPKTECPPSTRGSATSVVLPVLHIEGPGFSHQLKAKSSSLPGDDQPEVEDMVTEPSAQTESIWSELENLDQRHHRAIKKNNFFAAAGPRIGENYSELCVENSHKSKSTITLQLQTKLAAQQEKPKTNGQTNTPNNHSGNTQSQRKHTKSPRDKLYRSATHIATGSRHLFQSVNSYLNFNGRRAGIYSSEQYLDSNKNFDNPLRPLENQLKRPISKKLVAKYSDMEIQKELNDFFKIRSVK